jgi:hypothetical protein
MSYFSIVLTITSLTAQSTGFLLGATLPVNVSEFQLIFSLSDTVPPGSASHLYSFYLYFTDICFHRTCIHGVIFRIWVCNTIS